MAAIQKMQALCLPWLLHKLHSQVKKTAFSLKSFFNKMLLYFSAKRTFQLSTIVLTPFTVQEIWSNVENVMPWSENQVRKLFDLILGDVYSCKG